MEKVYTFNTYQCLFIDMLNKLKLASILSINEFYKTYLPCFIIMIVAIAMCFNNLVRLSVYDLITFII